MKVSINKSFEKDTNKISNKKILNSIADCIEGIQAVSNIAQVANCRKLRAGKNAYRIRIGDYRIGSIVDKNNIELVRFLHRKDIYKFFP